ncbi:MAG TPA: hypothetical protein VFG04_11105 [Planctomycetaceae bacterium]|jgi:hypothetical protein|nr:hypothetical protein [Planctomycetaceae bacterium]
MGRLLTLILGPIAILGVAFLATRPDIAQFAPAATTRDVSERPRPAQPPRVEPADPLQSPLVAACQRSREEVMRKLGTQFTSIVHTPFVIVGDLDAPRLERIYRETIVPAKRALAIAFFDRAPDKPVTIILLSGDEVYERSVFALEGRRRAAYAGFYERKERRLVVNLDTGEGTLAHELTHALAHFDFPDMPEWFDEGLGSLFEEARFSEDRLHITGRGNWRSRDLLPALKDGTLRPLESLMGESHVRNDRQALDYAHARYFCLYLQQRGLLEAFYRKFRLAIGSDPTGQRTLQGLFGVSDLSSIDTEFRAWALALERQPVKAREEL